MGNTYGVITEQGDLGLGFDPISEQEAQVIKENLKEETHNKESINESK